MQSSSRGHHALRVFRHR